MFCPMLVLPGGSVTEYDHQSIDFDVDNLKALISQSAAMGPDIVG